MSSANYHNSEAGQIGRACLIVQVNQFIAYSIETIRKTSTAKALSNNGKAKNNLQSSVWRHKHA